MTGDALAEFCGWLSTRGAGAIGSALWAEAAPDDTTGVATFVFSQRGAAPHLLASSSFIRKPRFRISTRSTAPGTTQGDYPDITAARRRAFLCHQACLDLTDVKIVTTSTAGASTGRWLFLTPESEPYLAGRDDHNRAVYEFYAGGERQSP